jgi:hypothetical protein
MNMGVGSFGGIWLLHLGVLAIVDTKLFKTPPVQGEKNTGMLVWGIIGLVVFGGAALEGTWGLFGSLSGLGYIADFPFPIIAGFFANAAQVGMSIFMVLSNVNRVRMRAPGFGILKVLLGAGAAFFAILLFISGFFNELMYY